MREKQMQLFKVHSFIKDKNVYVIDRGSKKFGKIYVDNDDNVIRTEGMGDLASFYSETDKGRILAENIVQRFQRKYKQSKSNLPAISKHNKPKQTITVFHDKKHTLHWDRLIANLKKQGWNLKFVTEGVYAWSEYEL